eukprot:gb/GECH01014077.1/.p1 GENE.gb/GECH01014077.1/~~gb/GECH01014077.1/.p1  ORF type:complete len:911 (+),score=189.08 gb/GECH01014077.1/:1-2733(+)
MIEAERTTNNSLSLTNNNNDPMSYELNNSSTNPDSHKLTQEHSAKHYEENHGSSSKMAELLTDENVDPVTLVRNAGADDMRVTHIQRLLKERDQDEEQLERDMAHLQRLKKDVVLAVKSNFILERKIRNVERRIARLVRNQMEAEDMKKELANSFSKIRLRDRSEVENELDAEFQLYEKLFYLLQQEPHYLAKLTRLVRLRNVDILLQTVVFTLFGDQYDEREENLLLSLFDNVLYDEFQNCENIGEFMRSNTAFTKMLSAVLQRSVYRNFLHDTVHNLILQVIEQEDLNLEINPTRVYSELVSSYESRGQKFPGPKAVPQKVAAENEAVQNIIKERIPPLKRESQKFLDQLLSTVSKTPYGLRFICKKIRQYGRERYPDVPEAEINSLVGGFIFLRFFNPSISSPDVNGSNLVSFQITETQRKNLTMICKVIQNLSNNIFFGSKESYMAPLNPLLEENMSKISEYFDELCRVENIEERLEMDKFMDFSSETRSINISFNEVAYMHKLCVQHLDKLSSSDNNDPLRLVVRQLNEIGPPPEQVPESDNFFFNLILRPLQEITAEELTDDHKDLYVETVKRASRVLKALPISENQGEKSLHEVLQEGMSKAQKDQDYLFARQIHELIENILKLEGNKGKRRQRRPSVQSNSSSLPDTSTLAAESYTSASGGVNASHLSPTGGKGIEGATANGTGITESVGSEGEAPDSTSSGPLTPHDSNTNNDYTSRLLSEIARDVAGRSEFLQEVQEKKARLEKVLDEILRRREYLESQLDMYKQYFGDAKLKTFQPNKSSSAPVKKLKKNKSSNRNRVSSEIVGPFKFKLSTLKKDGVITHSNLSKSSEKKLTIVFSSQRPGMFNIGVSAWGVKALKTEIDFDELLEMRERGEKEIEYESVTLDVNMLIHLLNKLFVVK